MLKLVVEIAALGSVFLLEEAFPWFPGRGNRWPHAFRNVGMGALNGAIASFLFAGLVLRSLQSAARAHFGLLNVLALPSAPRWILAFALFDLWMYAWHFANHNVPFLWRFHRMHHTDQALDSTSALRFHPGEIILSALARLIAGPLLGLSAAELMLYELCLQPVIIFHHSNAALPERWDRSLRAVLVTPNMHRVHHSQVRDETNSNYASIFSFWDRAAGTFRKREDTRRIAYGIPEMLEPRWQAFPGLLETPLASLPRP